MSWGAGHQRPRRGDMSDLRNRTIWKQDIAEVGRTASNSGRSRVSRHSPCDEVPDRGLAADEMKLVVHVEVTANCNLILTDKALRDILVVSFFTSHSHGRM
jgi:hypothetical protein